MKQSDAKFICRVSIALTNFVKADYIFNSICSSILLQLQNSWNEISRCKNGSQFTLTQYVLRWLCAESVVQSDTRDWRNDASNVCDDPFRSVLGINSNERVLLAFFSDLIIQTFSQDTASQVFRFFYRFTKSLPVVFWPNRHVHLFTIFLGDFFSSFRLPPSKEVCFWIIFFCSSKIRSSYSTTFFKVSIDPSSSFGRGSLLP